MSTKDTAAEVDNQGSSNSIGKSPKSSISNPSLSRQPDALQQQQSNIRRVRSTFLVEEPQLNIINNNVLPSAKYVDASSSSANDKVRH